MQIINMPMDVLLLKAKQIKDQVAEKKNEKKSYQVERGILLALEWFIDQAKIKTDNGQSS